MAKKKKKVKEQKNLWASRWLGLFVLLFLAVAALVFYSNSFMGDFQFDDADLIVLSERISNIRNYSDATFWSNINVRPLSYFSFVLNYSLHGQDTWGYHLVNLLIHIINAYLVFLLTRMILILSKARIRVPESLFNQLALMAALVFLLHPLQTMAVTYIVQRMSSMAALFYLLAVYLYARGRIVYADSAGRRKSYLYMAFAVISGVLAILAKQSAVTFPIAFLVFELYFIRDKAGATYKKYLFSGFAALVLAFIVISVAGLLPRETKDITRFDYLMTQFRVFLHYGKLLFIPVGQNVDHGIGVSQSLFGLQEIIGLLLILGLLFLAYKLYGRHRVISFGILWFFLTISVESSIIPIRDVMMEHRLYLPMFGFSLIVVSLIYLLCGEGKMKYCRWAFLVIIVLLGGLTYQRNKVWESDYELWKDSLEKNPENARAMANYGYAVVKRNLYNEAIRYYTKAIRKDSTLTGAYFNRSIAYFDQGQYERSVDDMNRVIEEKKDAEAPYFFRGTSYAHLRKLPEALQDLTRAIELNPLISETYKNRALVHEMNEDYALALEDFNKAIQLDPGNRKLLINRSKIHYLLREYQAALDDILWAERAGLEVDQDYIKMLQVRVSNLQDSIRPYYVIPKK